MNAHAINTGMPNEAVVVFISEASVISLSDPSMKVSLFASGFGEIITSSWLLGAIIKSSSDPGSFSIYPRSPFNASCSIVAGFGAMIRSSGFSTLVV